MNILFFCPHWGCEDMPLNEFLAAVKGAGYDGVEMNIPFDETFADNLKKGLVEYDLKLIAQQFLPPMSESPAEYEKRMEKYLRHLASFNPLFIDSHTGKDYYDFETNCQLIEKAELIAQEAGCTLLHETHRGRFNFSTFSTKPFFAHYPALKITADFSHWVCVSETYLDDQPEIMEEAIKRAGHIHARIGHTEGPQVSHPFAPEWQEALEKHLAWWDEIIALQQKEGKEYFTITPEFGAIPYLPTLPFTNQQVASQWAINVAMKDFLNERYNQIS